MDVKDPIFEDLKDAKSCKFEEMLITLIALMKHGEVGETQAEQFLQEAEATFLKVLDLATKFANAALEDSQTSDDQSAKKMWAASGTVRTALKQ